MSNVPTILVKNLNIKFGKKLVVKNVSFQVKKGEINGFLGISGAGKTTIVRVLTGQIPKKFWTGEVAVAGFNPKNRSGVKKILSKIGYVPQLEEKNLYYDLTPLHNIEIFASTFGIPKKTAQEMAEKLFKILDIPKDTMNNLVRNMSGGEKKRLSMALGMLNDPEILFLDEPTTGVDASKRYEILSYLKKLNEERHTTMVIITHDLEASNICDSVSILKDGELIEFAPPRQLIETLPSKGQIIRLTFDNLTEEMIDKIEKLPNVAIIVRTGIKTIEVFMKNINENLPQLITQIQDLNYKIVEMIHDIASFRTYFQLRIQEKSKQKTPTTPTTPTTNRGK